MPNLKDIKSRIGSVQNTKKITKAMKMVAAAKVKKAENTVKAARPFSDELLNDENIKNYQFKNIRRISLCPSLQN